MLLRAEKNLTLERLRLEKEEVLKHLEVCERRPVLELVTAETFRLLDSEKQKTN